MIVGLFAFGLLLQLVGYESPRERERQRQEDLSSCEAQYERAINSPSAQDDDVSANILPRSEWIANCEGRP